MEPRWLVRFLARHLGHKEYLDLRVCASVNYKFPPHIERLLLKSKGLIKPAGIDPFAMSVFDRQAKTTYTITQRGREVLACRERLNELATS